VCVGGLTLDKEAHGHIPSLNKTRAANSYSPRRSPLSTQILGATGVACRLVARMSHIGVVIMVTYIVDKQPAALQHTIHSDVHPGAFRSPLVSSTSRLTNEKAVFVFERN